MKMKYLVYGSILIGSMSSFANCNQPSSPVQKAFDMIYSNETAKNLEAYLQKTSMSRTAANTSCETIYHAGLRSKDTAKIEVLNKLGYMPKSSKDINLEHKHPWGEMNLFEYALAFSDYNSIRSLEKKGGKIESEVFNSKAYLTSAYNSPDVVKNFLRKKTINKKNSLGMTPLSMTMLRNSNKNETNAIAKLLIDHGADVNSVNVDLQTPIMAAAFSNNLEAVELLIQNGANVHATDKFNQSTLFFAVISNSFEIAKKLLESGVDVNTPIKAPKENENTTALTFAAGRSSYELIELLILAGADVNQRSATECRTPLVEAFGGNTVKVIRLLLSYGAKISYDCGSRGIDILDVSLTRPREFTDLYYEMINNGY